MPEYPKDRNLIRRSYEYGGSRRKRLDKIFQDYPHLNEQKLVEYLLRLYFYKLCQLGILPSFFDQDALASEVLEFELEFGAKFPQDQKHTLEIMGEKELVFDTMSELRLPINSPPTYRKVLSVKDHLDKLDKSLSLDCITSVMLELYHESIGDNNAIQNRRDPSNN